MFIKQFLNLSLNKFIETSDFPIRIMGNFRWIRPKTKRSDNYSTDAVESNNHKLAQQSCLRTHQQSRLDEFSKGYFQIPPLHRARERPTIFSVIRVWQQIPGCKNTSSQSSSPSEKDVFHYDILIPNHVPLKQI